MLTSAALAFANVGIYRILDYIVSQRTNEIGISLVGCGSWSILAKGVARGGMVGNSGCGRWLDVTIILMRLIQSMLFGPRSSDPLNLTASALHTRPCHHPCDLT